jgi:quinol monooxygenase YgiN
MYGTIARMQTKPGAEQQLRDFSEQQSRNTTPGLVFDYVYRSDANPNEVWLVVGFESKAAYDANAQSPDQHARYEQYRALLTADPEWHDGEIVFSIPA